MARTPELAAWILAQRAAIDRALAERLGARPRAAAPEAEALRRFRTFAAASLLRGEPVEPALEGLRVEEVAAGELIGAWAQAAASVAGARSEELRQALAPLVAHFVTALRSTAPARRASGAPRVGRRAVVAAIDRLADAFLAIDTGTGLIADANPAAGALLGVARDALLGADALHFVPESERERWWTALDAVSEGSEPRRLRASLRDVRGALVPTEASLTRFSTRERTLALVLARPLPS